MDPPYQALQPQALCLLSRTCGPGATTSIKIKYGLEASLSFLLKRITVWNQTSWQ